MDAPQMIRLDDVVLRDDLDPRLGQRDDDLIQQYADIFDQLPAIEINQDNELIDGWHRVRAAEHAGRSEIAYVVVEADGDDDLGDKMWAANLKHGVQYTRVQRQTQGLKLHGRGLKAKTIAQRVGVSASSVYSWTKALREKEREARDAEIARLREEGKTQQEIADEIGVERSTVAKNVKDSKTGNIHNRPESEAEPEMEAEDTEKVEAAEAELEEIVESGPAPDETETQARESAPDSPTAEIAETELPEEDTNAEPKLDRSREQSSAESDSGSSRDEAGSEDRKSEVYELGGITLGERRLFLGWRAADQTVNGDRDEATN